MNEAEQGSGEALRNTAEYSFYRKLCDSDAKGFRRIGIVDEQGYEYAKNDSLTHYVEIGGERVPLFVPISYAGGYNLESSQRLTGAENIYLLALPPSLIEREEIDLATEASKLEDASVVVESPSEQTDDAKTRLTQILSSDDFHWEALDFIDPRCPEGNQEASMSIYGARSLARNDTGEALPYRGKTLKELYEEELAENAPEVDVRLFEAADLQGNAVLLDQLWDLCDNKFEWLGEYHPVSMEETKDFFEQLLANDGTHSIIRFETNEDGDKVPVCHGFFMDDMSQLGWVGEEFQDKVTSEAEARGEHPVYFYGIVSKSTPEQQMHYSKDVITLYSRLMKRNGGALFLTFESTNMSSLYIPRLIQDYTDSDPRGMKVEGEITKLSQMDYWFLRPASSQTE